MAEVADVAADGALDVAPAPAPAFKKRTNKNIRKRPATPPPAESSSDSDDDTEDEAGGGRVKRRKKEGVRVAGGDGSGGGGGGRSEHRAGIEKRSSAFEADRSATLATNEDATKTSHWYAGGAKPSGQPVGPVKAPSNVRMVTVTDFAPDVCKDYKQTGFCGFGDSCKFLHAREDYQQGWQLDRDWEKVGKNKKNDGGGGAAVDEEQKMLDNVPFKCIICKDDYKRPVVTKCGHYFCEKCAMTRYMKEKKKQCANCGADTGGTFNVARKLNELLEKKRAREKANAEKQLEEDGNG